MSIKPSRPPTPSPDQYVVRGGSPSVRLPASGPEIDWKKQFETLMEMLLSCEQFKRPIRGNFQAQTVRIVPDQVIQDWLTGLYEGGDDEQG